MTPNEFIKKTAIKLVIFSFVLIVVSSIYQAIFPIIANEIALTQMQNYADSFVIVEMLTTIQKIAIAVKWIVIIVFMSAIGRDTYKFTKTIKENKEKN